jgi:NAD(P)-dependent dehydrogenase (short-subunit alcohol dehydrogenase family)
LTISQLRLGEDVMSRALIIGASGGIGAALVAELAGRQVAVTGLSRSRDGLDVTDEDSVAAALGALEGHFDLVVVATGALEIAGAEPEKTIRALSAQAMMDQFALNAVGPALVMKHAARLMPRDRRAVFAVLSARVGSIGDNRLGGWISYRAAKAAVNQIVHTGAVELARTHREAVCVALHPGTVQTAFTRKYLGRNPAVPPEEAARNLMAVIDGLRPDQSGGFFDWAGKSVPW